MGLEYTQKQPETKRRDTTESRETAENAVPNSVRLAAQGGAADPNAGNSFDLAEAMRQRMENAFGSDLSYVKEYESRTPSNAGPTPLPAGDPAYGGAAAPLSAASAAPAAGPMQASRNGNDAPEQPQEAPKQLQKGPELISMPKQKYGEAQADYISQRYHMPKTLATAAAATDNLVVAPWRRLLHPVTTILHKRIRGDVTKRANKEIENLYSYKDADEDEKLDAELETDQLDDDDEVYD